MSPECPTGNHLRAVLKHWCALHELAKQLVDMLALSCTHHTRVDAETCNIFAANAHHALDKAEKSEASMQHTLRKYTNQIVDAETSVTRVIALQKQREQDLVKLNTEADVASRNISQDSDNFKVTRRIVFFNGITDKYLMVIEGKCSIKKDGGDKQLEVTCKVGENDYKKHFLGISDNVTYFVEQVDAANVSVNHYKVVYKPETIVPDIELR